MWRTRCEDSIVTRDEKHFLNCARVIKSVELLRMVVEQWKNAIVLSDAVKLQAVHLTSDIGKTQDRLRETITDWRTERPPSHDGVAASNPC